VCLIRGSDLRLRLINPAYQAIAPGKEMVGKTLDELWPETGQDFKAICRRVLETGEPHQVADELNMIRRRPDGPLEAAYFSWSVHRVRLPGEEGWGLLNAAWETTERKLSEAALRDTEERLRLFIEYAPVSLAMFDLQMRYLGASRRWVNEYLGGTTDFIGHAHYEVFPDCPERWRAAHRRGLAGEIVRVDEDARTMANGQTLWARYEVRPWYAAGGTIGGIVIFTEDITGRKQAEAALRESRENLDRAQEVGLIGWWRLDTRTNVLTWSEQNYRIFGVPVGSPLTYDSFLEIVHPEDRAYVDSQWKAGLRGAPYDIEHRIVVGARVKWVREKAFLEFDTDGSLSGGFGITQDITERREAEKALRESEARFQLASEIGRSGTWDWDVTSGKVVWSRGHFEILGYEPGAVTPSYRAWADRVHPADLPGAEEEIRRTMAEHADYIRQFRVVWHDGSTHWMSARARYEYDVDGTCRRMLGVMADVTELKEAERQAQELSMRLTGLLAERTHLVVEQAAHLRELAVELTQAEQRERDRLYELLHDHVQPLLVGARLRLSALDGGSTIEAWVGSAAEVREHITAALNTARSLSVELNPPLVRDVGLGAALDWLRRSVKTHHGLDVQLKCESAAEPADAASRLLLFKAVRELLLNVAKHARTDKVSITMQVIPERMVQITVADRGVGFDAAARAGNQCAQAGSGLYDIGRRLDMIGGSIDIESEPGVGTTIRLTVPLAILAARAQRGTGAASLL
jgi:PAS domain S-box-containing protein